MNSLFSQLRHRWLPALLLAPLLACTLPAHAADDADSSSTSSAVQSDTAQAALQAQAQERAAAKAQARAEAARVRAEAQAQAAAERAQAQAEVAQQHAEAEQERARAEQERAQAQAEAAQARQQAAMERIQAQAEAAAEQAEQRAEQAFGKIPLLVASASADGGHKHHDSMDAGEPGGGEVQVDEHRPLDANGGVSVSDVAGTVVVTGWNRNEVAITGTLGSGVERLELTGDAQNLSVVVKLPKHSHNTGESDLRLMVPLNARVTLETVSADVSVQGTRGAVQINTVSGDVGLDTQSSQVAVQTVSGDLILRAPSAATQVNSVSGDLHLSGVQGKLGAETVSGNLAVNGTRFSELKLKSVSGDVSFDGAFTPQAQVTGETLSGNITLHVPDDITGVARVRSFSGEAQCEVRRAAMSPASTGSKKREFVFGDGKGVEMQLSTFSGDVRIDRRTAPLAPVAPLAPFAPPAPAAPPAPPAPR